MKDSLNHLSRLAIVIAIGFLFSFPAVAGFNDGVNAFKKHDYALAYKIFEPLAKDGNAKAQFALGLLYRNGLGLRKNLRKAHELYKSAAVQGYAKAQYNLGILILYLAKKK